MHRNPPLLDDDGYEVDSEDDGERAEEAIAAAAELDPYATIRLERMSDTTLPVPGFEADFPQIFSHL